MTLSDFDVLIW